MSGKLEFKNAYLLLEDGTRYEGHSFGAEHSVAGEAVFQTGMVGYPEGITDPSYEGQILTLTYPLVGNYGVPGDDKDQNGLPKFFESNRIHIAALVCQEYSIEYSHWAAVKSLGDWLKEENVPAIFGVDTRALTMKLRESGSMLAKIVIDDKDIDFHNPNIDNLVEKVSRKDVGVFVPDADTSIQLKILSVDVGMKFNQIRCFTKRGVELTVVPWNHDFPSMMNNYDGLFLSNGPGDPTMCKVVIENIRKVLETTNKPVFGICLGHQLMTLAAGGQTKKMKFGNRGHNIPCTDVRSKQCYITTQNHGYVVDEDTLPSQWSPLFTNANDQTNEGIYHKTKPFFSVQFHPESCPGPQDTEFLFDTFINMCVNKLSVLPPVDHVIEPVRVKVNKVLILGSGGLSIGQAGEFDYSGSQCIKALKEEGISTVLINPNIATIQTSKGLADKVYFLPVTPEFVIKVVKREKPDGILVTFGGQTALNCAIKIEDQLKELNCRVLGTPISAIQNTEDRELFAEKLAEINEKCAVSAAATSVEEAVDVAKNRIGYPVIVRAAFTLGGLGSGFAHNDEELIALATTALTTSPQLLIERSMKGWKEVEYEVVRDAYDNCVTVCNMENFDPLGVHTGDSIVVAPSQTLNDREYHMLRNTAVKTIRHLGVIGECNIQYALNPYSEEYCIIEVNARLSRSSALASKATGYPLAFVAAKLALGIPLPEIKNQVTKVTCSNFEPSLDYCVVKVPRWDLGKFHRVSDKVGSAMKSVGEVMSIGRSFGEAIQKSIRALDERLAGFQSQPDTPQEDMDSLLANPTDKRLFVVALAFERGYTVDQIHDLTRIDKWFLEKLSEIMQLKTKIAEHEPHTLPADMILYSKQIGFSDKQIAELVKTSELSIRSIRKDFGITPCVKQIDTVAAEFPAQTNYLYCTYNGSTMDLDFNDHGVIVLGSGVYRIGSSVEFDWCAVRAVRTLRASGYKTIMMNYNPETVSTDYDEVDRLYFENITLERCLDVNDIEQSAGVLLAMGGQVPNNIAMSLHRSKVKIFGTSPVQIDMAENRYKFSRLLDSMKVDQPQWRELTSLKEAQEFAEKVSYPVLVRPSYVLSGAAMNVVNTEADLADYLGQAAAVSREHPVVISKFIENAKEIEMDAVAKDGVLVMHVISEHVENAGVHSGDATLIQPPQDLDKETIRRCTEATAKIAQGLNVTGPMNIQFIAKDGAIKVIECNVRASRSFPFVSKVLDVDLIEMATKAMMDLPFTPYPNEHLPPVDHVGVKVPQFSFGRLQGADPTLGVEMASTGEVACFGKTKAEAYIKGLISVGFKVPVNTHNVLISIGSYKEKMEFLPCCKKMHENGFTLFASPGTADFISEHGIPVKYLDLIKTDGDGEYSIDRFLKDNLIDLYVCLPSKNRFRRPSSYMSRGYLTRRMAVDFQVPLITNIKCAKLFIDAIIDYPNPAVNMDIGTIDTISSHEIIDIPGLVDIVNFVKPASVKNQSIHQLAGGVTLSAVAINSRESGGRSVVSDSSYNDYTIVSVANLSQPSEKDSAGVFVPSDMMKDLNSLSHAFEFGSNTVFVTASGLTLASVLFLAKINQRPVHICQVSKIKDLQLVVAAKEQGDISVTCDVNPLVLFLTREECEASVTPVSKLVDNYADVEALWANLPFIDCFSLGEVGVQYPYFHKIALSFYVSAIAKQQITLDDIIEKTHTNPLRILQLPAQVDTYVEMTTDNIWTVSRESLQAIEETSGPLYYEGLQLCGTIRRVVVRGVTAFTEGALCLESPSGLLVKCVSSTFSSSTSNLVPSSPMIGSAGFPTAMMIPETQELSFFQHGATPQLQSHQMPTYATKLPSPSPSPMLKSKSYPAQPLAPAVASFPQTPQLLSESMGVPHLISILEFSRNRLHSLFQMTQDIRTSLDRMGSSNFLQGKVLVNLFYEPSTRTSCSFQAAMQKLGGTVINVDNNSSSVKKGETLEDTVRCLENYGDVLVIRHPEPGSASRAAKVSSIPVINAGDGIGEHPTQALLDVFTIREELGTVNGLTITLLGDLKNGRTTHSLMRLLRYYSVKVNLVSHESLSMPSQLIAEIERHGVQVNVSTVLSDDILANTDVLYVTRVQQERFADVEEYNKVKNAFQITPATLLKCKEKMCIMHPLPRVDEISPDVDFDPRAAYFRQMKYGLYVRMAILASSCSQSSL